MKNSIIRTILLLLSAVTFVFSQENNKKDSYSHLLGLKLVEAGKIDEATEYFKVSADSFSYSDSYYRLAKIYFDKNTVESRALSRKYIQKAIWQDPGNIEYRLLKAKLMEKFSRKMSYDVYEDILNIDKNCTEALFNLGRIKELDFYEYHKSILKVNGDPPLSFDEFAIDDFLEAESFFKSAIKCDSNLTDAYIHLSCLYEEIGEPQKGVPLLKKVIEINHEDKDAYTYLGLLYYKLSMLDSSYLAYKNALKLMDQSQKNQFKLQSTLPLLSEDLRGELGNIPFSKAEESIEKFWRASDPLLLTNYNERLLEHYSRVAYSNLRFSVPESEITGWNTDRGEILIRYGEPVNRIRYRPHISAGGRTSLLLKTDFWFYRDKVLGFVDEYWNGNFRFSTPRPYSRHQSQFAGDTDFFVKELRRTEPENYEPKFEGPIIEVPFNVVQFKNLDGSTSGKTDVYINYAMKLSNQLNLKYKFPAAHKYGLFLLDKKSDVSAKRTDIMLDNKPEQTLRLGLSKKFQINSIELATEPDSVQMAFEIMRLSDNGISANRFNFRIKSFDRIGLDLSDILLAEDVTRHSLDLTIKRNNLNILPNPMNEFTSTSNIFIYYEVYNLTLDENNTAYFEQRVTISKIEEHSELGNVVNSVIDFFGLGSEEDRILLSTKYQSFNRDIPVYFQIDMSKYTKGDYKLSIEVEDLKSGKRVRNDTMLKWR